MLPSLSYPIICTEKYSQTVAFYEDYLGYVPVVEKKDFVVLKRESSENAFLAIINKNHDFIPEHYRQSVSGMILSHPAVDVNALYQTFYWDGIKLISPPSEVCGRIHFLAEDPNGILIDVSEIVQNDALEVKNSGSETGVYEAF